jgi:hypothetical protein
VRSLLAAGCAFDEDAHQLLACRALNGLVVELGNGRSSALEEIAELIETPAAAGVTYDRPNEKLSGAPLYLCAQLDCPEAARLLLDRGASVTQPFDGESPLEAACRLNSTKTLALFLARVRELEEAARSKAGTTPASASDDDEPPAYAPEDEDEERGDEERGDEERGDEERGDEERGDEEPAADPPARPQLRRQWTHTLDGDVAEDRIHRRGEHRPLEQVAKRVRASAGWIAAAAHDHLRPSA